MSCQKKTTGIRTALSLLPVFLVGCLATELDQNEGDQATTESPQQAYSLSQSVTKYDHTIIRNLYRKWKSEGRSTFSYPLCIYKITSQGDTLSASHKHDISTALAHATNKWIGAIAHFPVDSIQYAIIASSEWTCPSYKNGYKPMHVIITGDNGCGWCASHQAMHVKSRYTQLGQWRSKKDMVVSHEMGHVMGLAHPKQPKNCMKGAKQGWCTDPMQIIDRYGVTTVYQLEFYEPSQL